MAPPIHRPMAINPYEPELAKRKTAFQIAYSQLSKVMNDLRTQGPDFRTKMQAADEALKDYRSTGLALADWLDTKEPSQ